MATFLRDAYDSATTAGNKAVAALRGLRMPGAQPDIVAANPAVTTPTPAAPTAAPATPQAVVPAAPAPAPTAAPAAPAAQGLRAPIDIYGAPQPGSIPRSGVGGGQGPGFTYGSANPALPGAEPVVTNPKFATPGAMSPEAAAYQASRAAPVVEAASGAPRGAEAVGRTIGRGLRGAGSGVGVGNALPALAAATSFAPHWDAFGDDSDLDAGQKLKLLARDTFRAAGGLAGGVVGGALGGAAGTLITPVAGTAALGAAGAIGGGIAGYNAFDAVGGDLRRGANFINEKLGGSPNFITSTDEDLARAGFDPNRSMVDVARQTPSRGGLAAGAPSAAPIQPAVQPAAATPPATLRQTPDDVAAFNRTLAQRGAGNIALNVDDAGNRTISNVMDANPFDRGLRSQNAAATSEQAQIERAGRDRAEQGLQARYAQEEDRRQSQARMDAVASQRFDSSKFDADIAAAKASGSATKLQAAYSAREAAQRDATANRTADMQVQQGLRGQDVTSDVARMQNSTAQLSAQRAQTNTDREMGLREREFAQQTKIRTATENRQVEADAQKRQQDASNQIQKDLEARFTTADKEGKPTFDGQRVGQARQYIDRAVSKLGLKSAAELDPNDKEQLLAGADLLQRVQGEATNWPIPWKPDFLKTADATDMVGMTRLANGDAQLRNGQVIPARFINKEGGDRIGGQPTNRFDILFRGAK